MLCEPKLSVQILASVGAVNVKDISQDNTKFDLLIMLRGKFLAMKVAYKKTLCGCGASVWYFFNQPPCGIFTI